MKLVLASKNQKKLVEMNEILSHLGIQVCSCLLYTSDAADEL